MHMKRVCSKNTYYSRRSGIFRVAVQSWHRRSFTSSEFLLVFSFPTFLFLPTHNWLFQLIYSSPLLFNEKGNKNKGTPRKKLQILLADITVLADIKAVPSVLSENFMTFYLNWSLRSRHLDARESHICSIYGRFGRALASMLTHTVLVVS